MEITIRKVKRTDIDDMNRIFNAGMKNDGSCLDIDPKDYNYRLEWISGHDKKHPVFVGEQNGRMVCWAALSRYSSEYPYDGVVFLTMQVDPTVGIQGLEESLLRFMEEQAMRLGYYKIIVSLFANNRTALHRYRTAGFRDVGIFRNHGFYKGELVDMVYMERLLPVEMQDLKEYYRTNYPFYEEFFCREEVMQELHMLRNGMMRAPDDPSKWIPAPKEASYQEDWGGATIRKAQNIPSLEELMEQRLAAAKQPVPEDDFLQETGGSHGSMIIETDNRH
ncbi:MAG: GNAT family N-acetyltransferase [Angelakisella sp.]